jgi:hypothetical protein
MTSGTKATRECLKRQINSIAGRNSCLGPWTAIFNASVVVPQVPRTNGRMQATINLANPLGGIDQLLHGSTNLRGWGSSPIVDGTLYRVRGFDPEARRYLYLVNPRFGNASPAASTFRTPFRITLDIRYDYGRSPQEQGLELNLRLKPPLVGTRAPADSIKVRYQRSGFTDLFSVMLRFADSLALSRSQMEQIQAEEKVLLRKADSIYAGLATYLSTLPRNYDAHDALAHVTASNDAAWQTIYGEAPFIRHLFGSGQLQRLPSPIREMLMTEKPHTRFFFGF